MTDTEGGYYPGLEFGLPAEGAGSAAGYGVRFAAVVIDLAVLSLAGLLESAPNYGVVAAIVVIVTLVVMPARWGATPGQAAVRLRVVPVFEGVVLTDRRGLTVMTAIARALQWVCFPFLFGVALLSRDVNRRTVVDRWTNTMVLEW